MATVGQQLPLPQNGWKRYNSVSPLITYLGQWSRFDTTNSSYQFADNVGMQSTTVGNSIIFAFTGTKLLLKCYGYNDTSGFSLIIDGVNYGNIKTSYGIVSTVVVYEKTDFSDKVHTVEITVLDKSVITNSTLTRVLFDSIDIDSSASLSPPPPAIPATTGKLCNTLDEMNIGDYIKVDYQRNIALHADHVEGTDEMPSTGTGSGETRRFFFYMIKVDIGLLVADRVTANTASWDTFNSSKWIQGTPLKLYGVNGTLRSLTGGVAWADQNGNRSLNFLSDYDLFPNNNEWDKYIMNFPSSLIQQGKSISDVWHGDRTLNHPYTWCQDTPANGLRNREDTGNMGVNSNRTGRAYSFHQDGSAMYVMWSLAGNVQQATHGFRPVFEYKEV